MRKRTGIAFGVAAAIMLAATGTALASTGGQPGQPGRAGTASSAVTVPGGLGQIPAAAPGPEKAGTISWGYPSAYAPNSILPIASAAANSVFNTFTFQWEMWRPLYWTDNGVTPELNKAMSLADPPVYSGGDRVVSITLKSSYKWSDGMPVTADDLLFDIDLIRAAVKANPSNWASYAPGQFPDTLASTSEPNARTLVMHLTKPVNPTWFTEDFLGQGPVNPLPSHAWAKTSAQGPAVTDWHTNPADAAAIYRFLAKQSTMTNSYASNPLWQVVDGPYTLKSYNGGNGSFLMTPNRRYGGPHAAAESDFKGVTFSSDTAEFNALRTGSLDVGYVPTADLPQLPSMGDHYFGVPDFGMNYAAYNYKDQTGHFADIVSQLYFRQAMAHLQDQQGYVSAYLHGAGDPAYGPIPAYPRSPYLPRDAKTDPYPFSVAAAVGELKAHGWAIHPGGADVCVRPGTGNGDCGAGIPGGTKLAFTYIYSTDPALIGDQAMSLESDAAQAGIHITLRPSTFNYIVQNYIDPVAPQNENKWAMIDFGGSTDAPYATTYGLFNTNGTGQIGDYSDPLADRFIHASIASGNPAAVRNEASYLTQQQPVLFQPVPDYIWAWKDGISGQPQSFASLTQYYATPEFWYFTG